VTGADGLVGSHLCRSDATMGLSRSQLDITDPDSIASALERIAPRAVINAAAQANVNLAETEFDQSVKVNGHGPALLADACRSRNIRLVHISTDYVLSGRASPGALLRESDPVSPKSRYAESKQIGEQAALERGAAVVRVQWVYRPGGRGFFTVAMERLAAGLPLKLVVDQIGSPTPSSVVAEGLLAVARGTTTGLYQLACEGETSAYGWIRRGAQLLGLSFDVEMIRRAELAGAYRPARSVLDSTRLTVDFGYRPPEWRAALAQAIDTEDWKP
jgi:dTDP-4-dehydrorhamnose reductase